MKTIILALTAVLLAAPNAWAQDDDPAWFDMANCEICQHMAPMMKSMHLIKWEPHIISTGMLSITVVPADLKDGMKKVKDSMMGTVAKLEAGKDIKCCGFCQSMGKLVSDGAKKQELETAGGDIMMLTSTDPKIVKAIHAHVKKTMAEQKKMMDQMSQSADTEKSPN